jgi:transcriptional regulator of acetoin/glycerol metabolism
MAKNKLKTVGKKKSLTAGQQARVAQTVAALLTTSSITEAAKQLGISRPNLHERINNYGLQETLNDIRANAVNELILGSNKAARKLVQQVDSDDEKVAQSASNSILDRAGVTKSDKNTTPEIHFHNHQAQQREKYDL